MAASDEQLLVSGAATDFATFYRRHARALLTYFARRVEDAEAAADLTAETFAAAVVAQARFDPARGSASAWLYGIASHKLADFRRRGRLEDRARRQLGMMQREVSDNDIVQIAALAREVVVETLSVLPVDQREAIDGHVIAEQSYEQLALRAGVSASAMRHRVSRGLRTLRKRLGEEP